MRKKTSTIISLSIAAILTAYISALTLPNQAFGACTPTACVPTPTPAEHHEVCLPCIIRVDEHDIETAIEPYPHR
jgi:hypothetical protein